jgi:hypothetical protein
MSYPTCPICGLQIREQHKRLASVEGTHINILGLLFPLKHVTSDTKVQICKNCYHDVYVCSTQSHPFEILIIKFPSNFLFFNKYVSCAKLRSFMNQRKLILCFHNHLSEKTKKANKSTRAHQIRDLNWHWTSRTYHRPCIDYTNIGQHQVFNHTNELTTNDSKPSCIEFDT